MIDIYLFIGSEYPLAAERYLDRIEAKGRLLQTQPRIGVDRADIRDGLRLLVEAPYVILYRIIPDTDDEPVQTVEIVRVVDGRRNLPNLF